MTVAEGELDLTYGRRFELLLDDLLDADDAPATLTNDDELVFTAKLQYALADASALVQLTGDSIEVAGDGSSATVTGLADDWHGTHPSADTRFVWDISVAVGGDEEQFVSLDRGEGVLRAPTTLALPGS